VAGEPAVIDEGGPLPLPAPAPPGPLRARTAPQALSLGASR
jgi:hypothetical protein